MTIFDTISFFGGLAVFLYGMTVLANSTERMSGGRLESTLSKITDNVFKSVLLGALFTMVIQSSSATTVILVGLVNARILKLRQAIGVIMGANIGTTITAHLISLSSLNAGTSLALNLVKPTTLAPIAAIVGILIYFLSERSAQRDIGNMLLGFSILFTGMFAMEAAVAPLRNMPEVTALFTSFQHPILGVLVGTIVTAIIQSSSASVGILQALASTGIVTYGAAYPIIMGQNIGTCITPVLASIGATKAAKRTALVHVSFNVIGTVLFMIAIYVIQQLGIFTFWNDAINSRNIANFHSIFNVLTTLLFLPFTGFLEKLAYFFIKPDGDEQNIDSETSLLDDRFLDSPSFAISNAREAVVRMANHAIDNYKRATSLLVKYDKKMYDVSQEIEEIIDRLQSGVDVYLIKLTQNDLTETDTVSLSEVLQVVNEFERIGDYCNNLCNVASSIHENKISFSTTAWSELQTVFEAVGEILGMAVEGYAKRDAGLAHNVEPLEEVVIILVEALKVHHSNRLREGICSSDSGFPYIEILYSLERIAGHCSNIGVHILAYSKPGVAIDRHEFLRQMRREPTAAYTEQFEYYDKKYYNRIKELGEII